MTFPSGWELVLVLLVILLLFGAKRLPDSARALGRSMRILKAETKGMRDDDAGSGRPDAAPRDGVRETTVTAEPLPPVQPPPAPGQQQYGQQQYGQQQYEAPGQPPQGGAQGDSAQQPRP